MLGSKPEGVGGEDAGEFMAVLDGEGAGVGGWG